MLPVHIALQQGCPTSPLLFPLYFDNVWHRVKLVICEANRGVFEWVITAASLQLFMLLFADDIALFSPELPGLERLLAPFLDFHL